MDFNGRGNAIFALLHFSLPSCRSSRNVAFHQAASIPDICLFFYTTAIRGQEKIHLKVRKSRLCVKHYFPRSNWKILHLAKTFLHKCDKYQIEAAPPLFKQLTHKQLNFSLKLFLSNCIRNRKVDIKQKLTVSAYFLFDNDLFGISNCICIRGSVIVFFYST